MPAIFRGAFRSAGGFLSIGSMTAIQQIIGAVTGILIVRALTREEYAQYSVATVAIAAVAVVAEGGVVATLMSIGGRRDGQVSRQMLREASVLRIALCAATSVVYLPVLIYLLNGTGSDGGQLVAVSAAVLAGVVASSASTLYASLGQLQRRTITVSVILLASAAARAGVVVALLLLLPALITVIGLLALTVLTSVVEFLALRAIRVVSPDGPDSVDRAERREAFKTNAIRQVPNSLFYVVQGLILPVILVAVGDPIAIADVNALARYSLAFAVVSATVSRNFIGGLARTNSRQAARAVYGKSVLLYLLLSGIGLTSIFVLSAPLLSLLGDQYSHLNNELVVISMGGAINSAVGLLATLNQSRAWTRLSWIQIPLAATWLVGLVILIRPGDVSSAAWFSALISAPGLVSMGICAAVGYADETRRPRD